MLAVCLAVAIIVQTASAESAQHQIVDDRIETLAEDLMALVKDQDLTSSCHLHFVEMETVAGPFLADMSIEALKVAITDILKAKLQGVACTADYTRQPIGAVAKEVVAKFLNEGRPGFVYTMSFFPKSGPNQMLLATAYRPNGRFAGFSGPLDVETVLAEANGQVLDEKVDVAAPIASDNAVNRSEPKPAPAANPETALASTTNDAAITNLDDLSAIGTPEEIEAILAMKFGVMPNETKLEQRPGDWASY